MIFFVHVGYNLAKEIPEPRELTMKYIKHITKNSSSMFIGAVNDREILDIVKTFKNKKSTDCFDIDMVLVKSIIQGLKFFRPQAGFPAQQLSVG